MRAVVGALVDGGCADPARIYATGMSMGGAMTLAIGCRMADEIAAIAPVAAPWGPAWIPSCAPSSPVPLAGFHGVEDPIVPYGGGPIGDAGLDLPPVVGVEEWAGEWADRNGCDPGPAEQPAIGDVQPLVWERCVAPVRLYRIEHAGHSWPGSPLGYPMTNRDISATDLIWDFFVEVSR